jgi:hypothetical protein
MALSYRKRGDVWHCRGTVRVGRRTFTVREFSTGCADKSDAEAVGAAEEARIRTEFINTGNVAEPSKTVTIKNCITAYKARPGGLHPFDVQRLDELDIEIGDILLSGTKEAWGAWIQEFAGGC